MHAVAVDEADTELAEFDGKPFVDWPQLGVRDRAAVMFTSGTTGRPEGCRDHTGELRVRGQGDGRGSVTRRAPSSARRTAAVPCQRAVLLVRVGDLGRGIGRVDAHVLGESIRHAGSSAPRHTCQPVRRTHSHDPRPRCHAGRRRAPAALLVRDEHQRRPIRGACRAVRLQAASAVWDDRDNSSGAHRRDTLPSHRAWASSRRAAWSRCTTRQWRPLPSARSARSSSVENPASHCSPGISTIPRPPRRASRMAGSAPAIALAETVRAATTSMVAAPMC